MGRKKFILHDDDNFAFSLFSFSFFFKSLAFIKKPTQRKLFLFFSISSMDIQLCNKSEEEEKSSMEISFYDNALLFHENKMRFLLVTNSVESLFKDPKNILRVKSLPTQFHIIRIFHFLTL